ncbi:hypothetical protein [Cedecea sp. NFIX57]|uniref:hypothetical protein n=1 Tax=Cedecea sp. NFIX57 TaxID=1566286 RepID=UPI000A0A5CCC|nr:hypothetical protein [Cedecea sp. NFIX57]SMG61642.1 Lipase (class 2) [Cedecea sp. NFIX57]
MTTLNSSWMSNNLPALGNKTLRQICMPGTHDTGMGTFVPGTAFAAPCNTVTQTAMMLGQLQAGARYFDIRPVIHNGKFYTGHYTELNFLGVKTWQGANGQSLTSLIDDVNTYTQDNPELVILNLSHDLDTDAGNSNYSPFNQAQWNTLLTQIQEKMNHLKVLLTSDLSQLTLNSFIGDKEAAVIIIVDPSGSNIDISAFASQGFYSPDQLAIYNVYANTNDLNEMISDQLGKMQVQRQTSDDPLFLLSWTLTQSTVQAVTCGLGQCDSILDMAEKANTVLAEKLLPACSQNCFPNIIYVDGINAELSLPDIAMNINTMSMKPVINPAVKLPVVLVHGRNADSGVWGSLKAALVQHGYPDTQLFGWNYDTSKSTNEVLSGEFSQYIQGILRDTGATQVDILAHSLGSLPTRWFIKFDGGTQIVRNWISLAGPNHGTSLGYLCALWDQGCKDMTPGSWVVSHLNQETETPGPTKYTTIWSAGDEQISPPTSTLLSGATNIEVSRMKHNDLLGSEEVFNHVINTLCCND